MTVETLEPTRSNKLRNYRFRELVALYLAATARQDFSPKREGDRDQVGDVHGSDRWLINVRNDAKRDFSGGADQATRDALTDGKPFACTVWRRPGRSVGESYVLLTLDALAAVLRNEAER